jgi:hypothetical protein
LAGSGQAAARIEQGESNRLAQAGEGCEWRKPKNPSYPFFPGRWGLIGNAVPVQLGAAIGRSLLDSIRRGSNGNGFSEALELALDKAVQRLRSTAKNKRGKNDPQRTLF